MVLKTPCFGRAADWRLLAQLCDLRLARSHAKKHLPVNARKYLANFLFAVDEIARGFYPSHLLIFH